ncbi:heat shock protein 70kD, peptide-binding domain-containing protein, partial [Acephala macrosclerotiorum]
IERYLGLKARNFKYPSKATVSTDEAIMRGAALQASHMEPWRGCDLTMEVTPLDYGIEMSQGVYARVLRRNFVIPTRKTRTFVTTANNQEKVVIPVFEGFRQVAGKNRPLGTLELTNLPPKPSGELEIELSFEMSPYYVLNVAAKAKESGQEVKLRVPPDFVEYYGYDGIEKLVGEAKEHYEEDLVYLERISHDSADEKADDGFRIMLKEGEMDLDSPFGP